MSSTLVRWAAIEAVSNLPASTPVLGLTKHRVAERLGKNIGKVAAARASCSRSFSTRCATVKSARCAPPRR